MNTASAALSLDGAAGVSVSARFIDNGDGTITDTTTNLMWSKATLTEEVNHAEALKVCAELDLAGHTDWRAPSVTELFCLADHSKYSPAIDTDAFPDTKSDWYWSSTVSAWDSSYARIVDFHSGDSSDAGRGNGSAFVRAVRSAPASQ